MYYAYLVKSIVLQFEVHDSSTHVSTFPSNKITQLSTPFRPIIFYIVYIRNNEAAKIIFESFHESFPFPTLLFSADTIPSRSLTSKLPVSNLLTGQSGPPKLRQRVLF